MAYIAIRKNREGNSYVYLVEGYRVGNKVKNRTLKSYGKLEDLEKEEPGIIERLREEAKEGLIGKKEPVELVATFHLDSTIDNEDKNYGWKLLDDVYRYLGIKSVVSDKMNPALKLLVFQRILNPGSKLATVKSQEELFGDWNLSENKVYRSLKYFNEVKEAIQLQVHQSISNNIGRVATLVFYDVTNYYFEIDMNDEDKVNQETGEITSGMRKKGASKENRKAPIVQMGLFMDSNGIPISYKLFEGNIPDVSTYCEAVQQVKKQYGFEKVVVVADKAMNSGNNIIETSDNKDGWLFSQKHRGQKGVCKKLQAFILDPAQWEYNEDISFGYKSMIRTRKVKTTTKPIKTKEVTEKVLVTWNRKYANREQIRRDKAIDYAEKLTNASLFRETCKKGGKKYLKLYTMDEASGEKKPFSPFIEMDQEAIDFDAQFDGVNVLVTSELEMSDEEMLSNYRELSKIEDCFRVTKTEFNARPIYVYKPEHIEAHFLTCFLALVIMRVLQHKINYEMSPARIIHALNSSKTNLIANGIYRVQANDDMILLNKLLDIEWEKKFVKVETLKTYGKGWCTTKK